MEKDHHSWERIVDMARLLAAQIDRGLPACPPARQAQAGGEASNYDALLVITRGGMVPGCLISEVLDLRNVLTAAVMFYTDVGETLEEPRFLQFPSDPLLVEKRILIVDDVWDSGKTVMAVRERVKRAGGKPTIAVLHFKPRRNKFPDQKPDYYAAETDAWIVYPWDPTAIEQRCT